MQHNTGRENRKLNTGYQTLKQYISSKKHETEKLFKSVLANR